MRKRTRRAGSERGFTLVELAIAITVLMIAVLTAARAQISSHNLMRTSRETNTAMADLRSAMEELLFLPMDTIPIDGSKFESGQAIAFFDDLHLRNERLVASYPGYVLGGAVPDPLQIVLTVTWNDYAGRARSMRLASMKTR